MLELRKAHEITSKIQAFDQKFYKRLLMAKGDYVPKIKHNKAMVKKIQLNYSFANK